MKTVPQFSALRRGALDLSFYPISYAGGEIPETNIGLMPGLVSSYKQGAAWKTAAVGKKFDEYLEEQERHHSVMGLAGWRVGEPRRSGRRPGGCQSQENPRWQPGDGHDAAGGRRHDAVDALE